MNDTKAVLMIAVISLVTMGLRFIPFLVFGTKKTPSFIVFLGKYLPYAIMGMLVVYCLKGVSLITAPFGIPELLAIFVVVGLHLWKRNTLISITAGTICYMVLIQFIF